MSESLPIVYSAHHASQNFGKFSDRCQLTSEQRLRYSDYGTAQTIPTNGEASFIAEYSRGLIDLNRTPNDPALFPSEDFGKPTRNKIWIPGQELTEGEMAEIKDTIYEPYHNNILSTIRMFKQSGLVVAWDNTAHYVIGNNQSGEQEMMRPIILSNRGNEESSEGEDTTTCDPDLLLELGHQLGRSLLKRRLPNEIHYNLVFKGGYIAQRYNTRTSGDLGTSYPIQSFQVEYDTAVTHDQETLTPNPQAIAALKASFEEAMHQTYKNLG
jgi:N-formylglutamate amidohydrolase